MTETNPFEWTEQERKRAKAAIENDARSVTTKTNTTVSEATCRRWRENVRNGTHPRNLDAEGFNRSIINKHITGNCQHNQTGIHVEHTGGVWRPTTAAVDGYETERLGWRYECPECGRRDIAVRWEAELLYCRSCSSRIPEVRDLQAGELVGFEDVDG